MGLLRERDELRKRIDQIPWSHLSPELLGLRPSACDLGNPRFIERDQSVEETLAERNDEPRAAITVCHRSVSGIAEDLHQGAVRQPCLQLPHHDEGFDASQGDHFVTLMAIARTRWSSVPADGQSRILL